MYHALYSHKKHTTCSLSFSFPSSLPKTKQTQNGRREDNVKPTEIEDDDKAALSGLSSTLAPSHKLHNPSSAFSHKCQLRNDSIDDIPFSSSSVALNHHNFSDDDDDDDLYRRSSLLFRRTAASAQFIGSRGGAVPFKAPMRATVHPGRPPCVELRPHPLRETQMGKFLRNIACTSTQLWAGQESGVRVWSFHNQFEPGCVLGLGRIRGGDEHAAPFHESVNTSPTMCLAIDEANKMVWSGHKDGKIRSWKTDQVLDNEKNIHLKEGLSWQAHQGPVLSLVISSYGDLWSGAEGGVIKMWPWDSIEKSPNFFVEERPMAALLVERSHIDLRSRVTVNAACRLSSTDVKCLLADQFKGKVWCAQPMSFSLWDARSKELLKVFNLEGQIENCMEMPNPQQQDQPVDNKMKVKSVPT